MGSLPLLTGRPSAGVGLCGSAARGDFVDGWSDVDFIAWNLPDGSKTAEALTSLVTQTAQRHGLHASLHLADETGGNARRLGPLYDMKMRAVMRRVGIDVPVIAGTGPTAMADAPTATDLGAQIHLLHDFATTRLQAPAGSDTERKDAARRVLSVLSSAARQTVSTREPDMSLRLPTVADALQQHWPACNATALLRDYDTFRRTGARNLDTAERLARQAHAAIRCIDKCTTRG
ncbi:hypothetical protein AB0M36_18610 [Actinoplanes sp. NPDC051346]|uniref:hypothetical protein n=1 Tax=Actinoplanes sp. NPDC051346 TaxID=3155048 RepID=UPI00343F94BF